MYGVIDIGSNSVRLMMSDGINTLSKEVNTTGLAEGLAISGRLKATAIERTAAAVIQYYNKAKQIAEDVFVFATEGVRSAENSEEFIDKLAKNGINIEVICGEKEATLGFFGAYSGGVCAIVDIGGGSTEIVVGDAEGIKYAKSVPIGAVRLRDIAHEDESILDKFIDDKLALYGEIPPFDILYGIGGTPGTLVSIAEGMKEYNPDIVHGYELPKTKIDEIYQRIRKIPMQERGSVQGLSENRRDIIVGAARLLYKIMDMLNIQSVTASERDNLEGYLADKLKNSEIK